MHPTRTTAHIATGHIVLARVLFKRNWAFLKEMIVKS
jgi:hypothetical protein